jgi:serine/threonine protein kinase
MNVNVFRDHYNKRYKNKITKTKVGEGGQSVIYKSTDPQYVIKLIPFRHPFTGAYPSKVTENAFNKEVAIGKALGTVQSARVIHDDAENLHYGVYRMKDYTYGIGNNYTASELNTYVDTYLYSHGNVPDIGHPVYTKLLDKLKKLYAAGYYHGDLHGENIIVIHAKRDGNNIKDVLIIDFGLAFKRDNKRDPMIIRLKNLWNAMNKQERSKKMRYYDSIMYEPTNNPEWFRKLNSNALVQREKGRNIEFRKRLIETNNT